MAGPVPTNFPSRILVVDDDAAIRCVLRDRLRALGHEVECAADGDEALAAIESWDPLLVFLDLRMPGKDGFAVLEGLKELDCSPQVVVITAHGSIEAAVKALKLGAIDFIPKPFDNAHVEHVTARCLGTARLQSQVARLETELSKLHTLVRGQSDAMARTVSVADRAAPAPASILLLGESGSGKEVLARYIHSRSACKDGPFIAVNCATLNAEMLQSELFGHEKGAFTGAVKSKLGRIEQAAGGTLFLDEIAEFAPVVQAKLLRVVQERVFERLGGTQQLDADVRIIAATHRDLPLAIQEGRFREDLYYRLNVVSVRVPSLRERPEDIPALLTHFLQRHGARSARAGLSFDDETVRILTTYAWPGNVRELSNVVERAVVLSLGDVILPEDLPDEVRESGRNISPCAEAEALRATDAPTPESLSYHDAVLAAKCQILRDALDRFDNHQTNAAKALGLSQPYMARLLKNLGLKSGAKRVRR